jgi:hypothetical protein
LPPSSEIVVVREGCRVPAGFCDTLNFVTIGHEVTGLGWMFLRVNGHKYVEGLNPLKEGFDLVFVICRYKD